MKTIIFTHGAAKDLDALPKDGLFAVTEALSAYAVSGRGDVKRLVDRPGSRLRIGSYRVVFNDGGDEIEVVYVGRRTTTTY